MDKIRIVTDSTADLPQELINEYGIIVVPLKLNFGQKVYRDWVDITPAELISRLNRNKEDVPLTSQPSPGEFVAIYENLIAKGETVISIHLSGKLSGTVQSAHVARTMADSKNIHVIDSCSASMGLGLIVLAAAKAAKEGKSVREVLNVIKEKIEKTFILFLVDTLEYLEKGGRIGKASALLGTLLKIKPILTVQNGTVTPLEKVRGKNRALERMVHIISEKTSAETGYNCSFLYGNDYAGLIKLKDQIKRVINCNLDLTTELGAVIMSHTGPGVIGVAISPEQ